MTERRNGLLYEIANFFVRKNVRKASHSHGMLDLFKFIERRTAYTLSGGVCGIKFGMRCLQLDEFTKEHIVFIVRDLGGIVDII